MAKREENPFEDESVANQWIESVENEKDSYRDRTIYPRLRAWQQRVTGHTFLEIGSGQGICSSKIDLSRDQLYVGVEPSIPLMKRAKDLYSRENKTFLTGSAYEIPVSSQSFDGAFSVLAWMHFEKIHRAAQELKRVLKPGGQFFIITANPSAYDSWRGLFTDVTESGPRMVGKIATPGKPMSKNIIYFYSLDELKQSLLKAGLHIERTDSFGREADNGSIDYFLGIYGSSAGD